MMKMIVCGSRTWGIVPDDVNAENISFYLERAERHRYTLNHVVRTATEMNKVTTIITGGARGADDYAHEWARKNKFETQVFPADWDRLGKAAGPMRNERMLEESPGLVVAFVDKPLLDSKGTADMVRRATKAGVPVWLIEDYDRR